MNRYGAPTQYPGPGILPPGGAHPSDIRAAIQPVPKISRYLSSGTNRLIMGSCPTCKIQLTDWEELKAHVQLCRRTRQHPLLMRNCYCPFCVKKHSDAYALSSHIHHLHFKQISDLRDEHKGLRATDTEGVEAATMREPFPFNCSACKLCFPTAQGIAEHFVAMETGRKSCGGSLHIYMKHGTRRSSTTEGDERVLRRYEFAMPVTCPYCPAAYGEAYDLNQHINQRHSGTRDNLHLKLQPLIPTQPKKKLFYEPFMCSVCHSTFKNMEGWAAHYHDRVMNGQPCHGELRVVKYKKEISAFVTNMAAPIRPARGQAVQPDELTVAPAPAPSELPPPTLDNTCNREVKTEAAALQEPPLRNEIKDEPMDTDKALFMTHLKAIEDEAREREARMDAEREAMAQWSDREKAAAGQAVVKDEPVDTGCYTAAEAGGHFKDEPMDDEDEPAPADPAPPSVQNFPDNVRHEGEGIHEPFDPNAVKKEEPMEETPMGEKSEEDDLYDCEECDGRRMEEKDYIEHMKTHGYYLAQDLSEEQIRQIEATAQTPAKKVKTEEGDKAQDEVPTPLLELKVPFIEIRDMGEQFSRPYRQKEFREDLKKLASSTASSTTIVPSGYKYPPLVTNAAPSEKWFQCQSCPEMCTTIGEYNQHILSCHSNSNVTGQCTFLCSVCKKRKFASNEARNQHENECSVYKLTESRERVFNESVTCVYCKKRQGSAYVLAAHIMTEHADVVSALRFHFIMASEFLPFRCSTCNVGFEDPRILMQHYRQREEFGIPCSGNLIVHSYEESLRAFAQLASYRPLEPIAIIPEMDDLDYDIYMDIESNEFCPRDPPPGNLYEPAWKTKCPYCPEQWPRAQIKLHVKHEHPRDYFDMAPFKCKVCRHYNFFCSHTYAAHFEKCVQGIEDKPNERLLVVAPRVENFHKPSAFTNKLELIPEEMGNELRPCRFCKAPYSPEGLLQHQKTEHPVEHFCDAPYQCQKCGDVGFYRHNEYKMHTQRCNGQMPAPLGASVYAITLGELELRREAVRLDVPSYRSLVDEERRKSGTLAAFNRSTNCPLCEQWNSCMLTLAEHYRDGHRNRSEPYPFLCGGCGTVFIDALDLKRHLINQDRLGNSQCYDMASVHSMGINHGYRALPYIVPMDPNRTIRTPPVVSTRANNGSKTLLGESPVVSNWRSLVGLEKRQEDPPVTKEKSFVNLARQQAAQKRKPLFLPIRPLNNILSKSPLMGERNLWRQQQVEKSLAAKQTQSYYKQVSAYQRQRQFVHVDPATPLALPSSSAAAGVTDPSKERKSFAGAMPKYITQPGRIVAGAHTSSAFNPSSSRPVHAPTSSFRADIIVPVTPQSSTRFRPARIVPPSSNVKPPVILRSDQDTLMKEPKQEPKQEPI